MITSASQAFTEHHHATEVIAWVRTRLSEELHQLRQDAFAGKDSLINKLPALSLAPMIGLYFAAFGADKMSFTDEYIEYEFSPVSLRLNTPKNLYDEFVKSIDTDFAA